MKVLALAAALWAAALPAAATSSPYQTVSVSQTRAGALLVWEEVIQEGSNPLDRFTLHRVVKAHGPNRGAVLLLPGGGSNFALFASDPSGRIDRSPAGLLAEEGFDVWGYSPRTRGIPAGACGVSLDCSPMAGWGIARVVADATYIRGRIRAVHGSRKPVIGGWSLGAMTALATLDAHPRDYAGAILWEGMLYSEDPDILAANASVCAALEARLAAGEVADDTLYPPIRLLYDLAVAAPDAPSPVPGLPPGLTNRQAYLFLLTLPQPAPPGFVDGYTLVRGSSAGFTYAAEERIAGLVLQLNSYEPVRLIRDYTCALGGERTFTSHLRQFRAPVYAIGGGHGFGPHMGDQLALLGSRDIERNFVAAFAHADHYASPQYRRLLIDPLVSWLRRVP